MRAMLALLLLFVGSAAAAGPFNWEAMLAECAKLEVLKCESPALCEIAIQKAKRQHPIFKDAAREYYAKPDKETERRMVQQSNILSGYYAELKRLYPNVWDVREKPRQNAAN